MAIKRTCDMEVGEEFFVINNDGVVKNMIITSREIDEDGLLIVRSSEVTA